jgi:hypothetical protein
MAGRRAAAVTRFIPKVEAEAAGAWRAQPCDSPGRLIRTKSQGWAHPAPARRCLRHPQRACALTAISLSKAELNLFGFDLGGLFDRPVFVIIWLVFGDRYQYMDIVTVDFCRVAT